MSFILAEGAYGVNGYEGWEPSSFNFTDDKSDKGELVSSLTFWEGPGSLIRAMQITWNTGESRHYGSNDSTISSPQTLTLAIGERISSISIWGSGTSSGDWPGLRRIKIVTNRNQTLDFGDSSLPATPEQQIQVGSGLLTGVFGFGGDWIDRLGFYFINREDADYGIRIEQGSKLVIASNNAYDLGEHDFTVTALFQTTQPGIIISQMPSEGGGGDGGWFLYLQANGAIELSMNRTTVDGPTYYKAISTPTIAFDGSWHSIAAIRQDGNILIFFDGISIDVTSDSNDSPPFNVSNSAQIFIGDCDHEALQFLGIDENISQFIGILEDISIWNRALSQDEVKRTMFNRITAEDPGLVGFWEMNRNLTDTSHINNPAIAVGSVSWVPIFHCVWAETINNYSYCAIDLSESLVEDHGVQIGNGGMITIPPNSAYNFGLGEFTVTAIFQTTQPGIIASCKSNAVTTGGWLLALEPNGWFRMKFWNNDGRYFNVFCSRPTKDALDGQWHHIAFTRKPGTDLLYKFFFDGQIAGLVNIEIDNPGLSPIQAYFDIHDFDRVVIGNCDNEQEANRQFVGIIEDVTIWNQALNQDEIQRTRFNETNPNDPGLVGFWKLDQDFDDSSPTRNNGSGIGSVQFVEVSHQAERQQTLKIAEGTSYLYGVALDKSQSSTTFPEGALVKVFRPDGTQLDQDSNTDDIFVKMNGDSVWAFTVKNPQAGDWKFAVECPTSTPFLLSIQTTPSKDIAPTIGNTLQELYVDVPATRTQNFSTLASIGNSISASSTWGQARVMSGVSICAVSVVAAIGEAATGIVTGGLLALGTTIAAPAVIGAIVVLGLGIIIGSIATSWKENKEDIKQDGKVVGEAMTTGNIVMLGCGKNSYSFFVYDNTSNDRQESVKYNDSINIDRDVPYLYAVLTQNDNSIDFPVGVVLNIQAPDGTNYNHDIQDENSLAIISDSSIHCLIIKNPQPGNWNIAINAPAGVKFHCELSTVPSKDVFNTIADTFNAQDDAIDQLVPAFIGITDAILIGNKTDNVSVPAKDLLYLFTTVALGQDSVRVGSQQIPLTQEQQKQVGKDLTNQINNLPNGKRARGSTEIASDSSKRIKTETENEKIPALVTWNMQGANWDNSGSSPWDALARWFREGHNENNRSFPYKIQIACLQECGSPPPDGATLDYSDLNNGIERYFWILGTETRPLYL